MQFKTIALATAFVLTSSLAFAQSGNNYTLGPAPIGSEADFGNRALINRGPIITTGEDRSDWNRFYATPDRSRVTTGQAPLRYRRDY
jgi:hypothetical protein